MLHPSQFRPRSTGKASSALYSLTHEQAQTPRADRFIPRRPHDADLAHYQVEAASSLSPEVNASPAKEEYKKRLASNLFDAEPSRNARVLSFGAPPNARPPSFGAPSSPRAVAADDSLRMLYTLNRDPGMRAPWSPRSAVHRRWVPQTPERILDAPELIDDYYLNLLDWNRENVLAVALGDSVYLWNASTGAITALMQTSGTGCHVTSIAWAPHGCAQMAIGTSDHKVSARSPRIPRRMPASGVAREGDKGARPGRASRNVHSARARRHRRARAARSSFEALLAHRRRPPLSRGPRRCRSGTRPSAS